MNKDNFDFENEFQETPKKKSYADLDLGLDFDLSFLDDIDESVLDEPAPKPPVRKPAPAKKPAAAQKDASVRKAAPAAAEGASKKAPARKPASAGTSAGAPAKKAPVKKPAAAAQNTAAAPAKKATPKKQPVYQEEPVPSKQKQKKGPRLGGVIFYTLYFTFILAFFVATYFGLMWLHGWLSDYELAQPTVKAEQVFREVFTDPDWGALYESAGAQDSPYEGKEEYVAYMEAKVGGTPLTYLETSAGLSQDKKKYNVSLDGEKVASFTLVDRNQVGTVSLENLENITDIPDWQLGAVEVFFEREETYYIVKLDGHTAYVNGVALGEDLTIQKATTKAYEHLPEGTTGASMDTQQISGLMELPTVTVTDKEGNQMTVTYDEATRTFTERTESNTMSEDQKEFAIEAAKTYSLYMIEEINDRGTVAKYFDASSETYAQLMDIYTERWMQNNSGYEFTSSDVTDFAAYGDDLFSARVSLMTVVTRTNGTTRDYSFEKSMIFRKQENGKWICIAAINEDISEPVGQVRLTFKQGDSQLTSGYVDTDASQVVTPNISVGPGMVLTGWATLEEDETGALVYNLVFQPDETGIVSIPDGTTLKPMTLYAVIQSESEAQAMAEASAQTAPAEATEGV